MIERWKNLKLSRKSTKKLHAGEWDDAGLNASQKICAWKTCRKWTKRGEAHVFRYLEKETHKIAKLWTFSELNKIEANLCVNSKVKILELHMIYFVR